MKKNIAVIFGGQTVEHDVSIITAHIPIIQSLFTIGQFNVYPVYIAKNGSWYSNQAMNNLDFFKQENFEEFLKKQKKIQILFDQGLKLIWPGFQSKTIKIDIVFPAMHGTFGEDGSLMGLLRMANIPFVGCDLFASAIAMDKVLTKQILSKENISVVPYIWFTKFDWENNKNDLREKAKKLKWPIFVKPVHLGSSIAITKVKQQSDLENAIEVAFHYDDKVLIEESIENLIEVTLPIMGNDILQTGSIERPLNKTEFFNFNDKYLSGGKKNSGIKNKYSEIPAKIKNELAEQVKDLGLKTYRAIGCSGISRIDFLIENNFEKDPIKYSQSKVNKVFVNEINTLPGTLYCHNWRKSGVSNTELITKLIVLAEERFNARQKIIYTFNSDILNKI
ncbi:MAG: D-alanine--D-alanine ligase family protein [Candidatus Kuenenbacteria bacterium]